MPIVSGKRWQLDPASQLDEAFFSEPGSYRAAQCWQEVKAGFCFNSALHFLGTASNGPVERRQNSRWFVRRIRRPNRSGLRGSR